MTLEDWKIFRDWRILYLKFYFHLKEKIISHRLAVDKKLIDKKIERIQRSVEKLLEDNYKNKLKAIKKYESNKRTQKF